MAYATIEDLSARVGGEILVLLADEDGNGAADPAAMEAALGDAALEIDAALAGRYATPLSPPPPALLRANVDLAIYLLYLRRREAVPRETLERAKETRAALAAIAQGKLALDGAAARLDALEARSTTLGTPRSFDRETLGPF